MLEKTPNPKNPVSSSVALSKSQHKTFRMLKLVAQSVDPKASTAGACLNNSDRALGGIV